jgi:hypothetical protein
MALPTLTAEQRADALIARVARKHLLEQVKSGEVTLRSAAEVWPRHGNCGLTCGNV